MTDRFSEILQDLGKILGLSLKPDHSIACSIQLEHLTIQLELDPYQENLIFFSKIIELPPGRFRDNILTETLKANGRSDPRPAIFGYLHQTSQLCVYQTYPLAILNGERCAALLGAFFEQGNSWYQAIQNGQSSPPEEGQR